MTLVDGVVANRLALQVCRNGEHLQAVAVQDLPPGGDVVVINGAADDIEMIPGAGDLEPVVAPFRRQLRNLLDGRSAHWPASSVIGRLIVVTDPAGRGCRRYGPPPARRSP